MTIVVPAGQYPEGLQGYGHVPGVRGGAIGAGAKIVSKLTYRGTKWLSSRFFKPKGYTYRGATARGIAVGTLVSQLLPTPDIDDLDGTIPPIRQTPNPFGKRNFRFNRTVRDRRRNYGYRHSNDCKQLHRHSGNCCHR